MTEIRTIHVKKRSFRVRVSLPVRDSNTVTVTNADDTYIARNGDTYIARNGDTYVAHNTTSVIPRVIHVNKRRFRVLGRRL